MWHHDSEAGISPVDFFSLSLSLFGVCVCMCAFSQVNPAEAVVVDPRHRREPIVQAPPPGSESGRSDQDALAASSIVCRLVCPRLH